jgi:hypothetical protein
MGCSIGATFEVAAIVGVAVLSSTGAPPVEFEGIPSSMISAVTPADGSAPLLAAEIFIRNAPANSGVRILRGDSGSVDELVRKELRRSGDGLMVRSFTLDKPERRTVRVEVRDGSGRRVAISDPFDLEWRHPGAAVRLVLRGVDPSRVEEIEELRLDGHSRPGSREPTGTGWVFDQVSPKEYRIELTSTRWEAVDREALEVRVDLGELSHELRVRPVFGTVVFVFPSNAGEQGWEYAQQGPASSDSWTRIEQGNSKVELAPGDYSWRSIGDPRSTGSFKVQKGGEVRVRLNRPAVPVEPATPRPYEPPRQQLGKDQLKKMIDEQIPLDCIQWEWLETSSSWRGVGVVFNMGELETMHARIGGEGTPTFGTQLEVTVNPEEWERRLRRGLERCGAGVRVQLQGPRENRESAIVATTTTADCDRAAIERVARRFVLQAGVLKFEIRESTPQ